MKIIRSGSLPSATGPEAWFTGAVRIDAPFQASEPASVGGATVTFEPGAHGLAYASPGTNADCDAGARLVTGVGRRGGNPESGRYRLDPTRREALARRKCANGDDAYRHRRSGKRQPGNVAGKSDRRTVPERLTAKNGNRLLQARLIKQQHQTGQLQTFLRE